MLNNYYYYNSSSDQMRNQMIRLNVLDHHVYFTWNY